MELRENEYKDLYKDEPAPSAEKKYTGDCQIDTDFQVLLPDTYISNISERIRLYRELDNISDEDGLQVFAEKLKDRFGPVPEETRELMNIVRLRKLAMSLGFEKIIIRRNQMIIYFIQNSESDYYNSDIFKRVLMWVQKNPRNVKMKEDGEKLTMKIEKILCIGDALKILQDLNQ